MVAHVKSLGFASHNKGGKPITHIKEHIKYMEADREHHRNEPDLFNQDQDKIDRRDFFQKLNEQPKRGVVGHKLVISLSEEERQNYKTDLKELVRDTMNRFEGKHNIKLDWIASVHDDEGHPHAHVVIRGYNEEGKQVGMYPKHIKDFQKFADQEKERQFERNQEPERNFMKEMEQEREIGKIPEKVLEKTFEMELGR
ncbi:relaxase [Bacillus cereus]|nr:relaxase [Bacillus cereus]ONG76309.1 relaxase [Bacillus cereus]